MPRGLQWRAARRAARAAPRELPTIVGRRFLCPHAQASARREDAALELDDAEARHAAEAEAAPAKARPHHAVSRRQEVGMATMHCDLTAAARRRRRNFSPTRREALNPAKTRTREASSRRTSEALKVAGRSLSVVRR